ncbi:hypothetical protein [Thalassolituus marinus]|jgi:hypothetical protein|uniref:Uncharacterized protein n=1 Tax=Thalassolituus marinus TaxID=671053 RepID=A0ABS7ZM59_9GAMM|nr:hypothetical protein [Thalassolituus marinus]MCA6062794.1 hypothetical protein [Thalassolituus marinus]
MALLSRVMTTGALALVVGLFSNSDSAVVSVADPSVASLIRNATFLERTPEFTDLYIIKTWDKGRHIVIYCNSAYCYKQRGHKVMV